jgi:hypothetical protein
MRCYSDLTNYKNLKKDSSEWKKHKMTYRNSIENFKNMLLQKNNLTVESFEKSSQEHLKSQEEM